VNRFCIGAFYNVKLRLPRFPSRTINTAVMAEQKDAAAQMAIVLQSIQQLAQVLKQM
jgi:hypothetical protein